MKGGGGGVVGQYLDTFKLRLLQRQTVNKGSSNARSELRLHENEALTTSIYSVFVWKRKASSRASLELWP